jgi:hypothetical protein
MRLLTGSVIPGLITHSTIPVLVCRQPSPGSRIEYLAAGDGRARRQMPEPPAAAAEEPAPPGP